MAETSDAWRSDSSAAGSSSPASDVDSEESAYPETSQDARNMAMLCHLLGIFGFIAPLFIWLSERDEHRFVDEHGRAAMNYQISFLIYLTGLCITFIGAFLVPILIVVHVVLSIVGTVKASRGEPWVYPIAIAFLK